MANKYWSEETNPKTGKQFAFFRRYLSVAHNGCCDLDALLSSEYGEKLAERLDFAYRYDDPMDPALLHEYESMGLRKQMFELEDYWTRWALFTPLAMLLPENKDRKYPLVFSFHGGGNSLESEEFSIGLQQIAAKEGFMICNPQNTNADNVYRLYQIIKENYPVDTERVYATGFSQGGMKTTELSVAHGEILAAAAPSGNDIWDAFSQMTQEKAARLKEGGLPFCQVVGDCEVRSHVPYNIPPITRNWGVNYPGDPIADAHRPAQGDPTQKGGLPPRFLSMPKPSPEERLQSVNTRLWTLGCKPLDVEACLKIGAADGECAWHTGFHGDREKVEWRYGLKHYVTDIDGENGLPMFRHVSVANHPHWPPVTMGQIVWDFFKQFKRDAQSGKIVLDPYQYK